MTDCDVLNVIFYSLNLSKKILCLEPTLKKEKNLIESNSWLFLYFLMVKAKLDYSPYITNIRQKYFYKELAILSSFCYGPDVRSSFMVVTHLVVQINRQE